MKIIITEQQLDNIQKSLEEEYPVNWNVEEFKNLRSFSQRVKYCEQNLKRISSGSGRIVYKIDDEKVLKLAKNKKGVAQNEVEIQYSGYYDLDDVVAKVFNYDENNLWVEMELARKVTPPIFQQETGVDFKSYCDAMRYHHSDAITFKKIWSKPDNMDEMWENEFVYEMLNTMVNYEMPVGDLCHLSTYGLVKRDGENRIVIIDYGLTNDVYDSYYK